MPMQKEPGQSKTTATDADRAAIARCFQCMDDGEDTDIGRPAIDRLVALGWLDQVQRNRWEISGEGYVVLSVMRNAESV